MSRITKEDLIESIAGKTDAAKSDVGNFLNTLIEEVKTNLKAGNEVVLTGFGTFSKSHRKARDGRNPQTGATIKIAAKDVPKFKAGKGLKDAVA